MATMNDNIRVDALLKKDAIPYAIKRMSPNAETRAALAEYIEMQDKAKYKRYENFDDVIKDKDKENEEYLTMLDKSIEEAESNKFILKSIDELGEYE